MWTDGYLRRRSRTSLQIFSLFQGWCEINSEDVGTLTFKKSKEGQNFNNVFRNAALRKLNDLIKRARLAKVWSTISCLVFRKPWWQNHDLLLAKRILDIHDQPKTFLLGACLHHFQLEEGHAERVWEGEEAKGAHQGSGCIVSWTLLNKYAFTMKSP